MKAKKNYLIVKAFIEQKESHEIVMPDGSKLNLFLGRKYNENNREANPTICEVIVVGDGIPDISVGDNIILHHNTITNEAIQIEKKDGYVTLNVHYDSLVYAKVLEDGTLVPLKGYIIAERIEREKINDFDVLGGTEKMKFNVISTPSGYDDVKPNQKILCYKLSDYEMVYHYKNKECRAIRISQDDILGVFID